MTKANNDIRKDAKFKGVKMWMLADALHIHESTLCRWLRHELPEDEKARIRGIIAELGKEVHQ